MKENGDIRNEMKSSIPIIALTADVTTVDLKKCKSVGMDDYISKPVNETILYSKIVKILEKVNQKKSKEMELAKPRCIDMEYLMQRTKSNPQLMSEMIALYLEQTPVLISTMKQSFNDKDWDTLQATVHKMIPSFSIVGINQDFENMAKKVQEFASKQNEENDILEMVLQLENICSQACRELEEELLILKK